MPPHDATDALLRRLSSIEGELRRARRRQRWWVLAAAGLVFSLGTAWAADGACPNGLPFCFVADQPARASEVNHNFAQLKEWLEAKVGAPGGTVVVASPATFSNTLTTSGTASFSGPTTFSAPVTFGNPVTFNGAANFSSLNVSGAVTSAGFDTSCAPGVNGGVFAFCCRIDIRTGATTCRIGTNWQLSAAAPPIAGPFGASTPGSYRLSCFGGVSGFGFPGCCRTDVISGAVQCVSSNNWQLSSWTTPLAMF